LLLSLFLLAPSLFQLRSSLLRSRLLPTTHAVTGPRAWLF